MAATISDLANGVSITLNTTCVTGSTVTASVGDWLVVFAASSNDGTLGAASQTGVVDSDGVNVYVQRALINYDPGAAGAGATLGIYTCQVTNALSGDTITVNHSGNTSEKAVQVYRVQPGAGEVISVIRVDTTGATGNDTSYAAPSIVVDNGDIIFAGAAIETDDAVTGDTDTTNGSWSSVLTRLADNGADAATMSSVSQYKTVNATGTQAWAATTATARDNARTSIVLRSGVPIPAPLQTSGFEAVLPLPCKSLAIASLTIALNLLQSTLGPSVANNSTDVYPARSHTVLRAASAGPVDIPPNLLLTTLAEEEPPPDEPVKTRHWALPPRAGWSLVPVINTFVPATQPDEPPPAEELRPRPDPMPVPLGRPVPPDLWRVAPGSLPPPLQAEAEGTVFFSDWQVLPPPLPTRLLPDVGYRNPVVDVEAPPVENDSTDVYTSTQATTLRAVPRHHEFYRWSSSIIEDLERPYKQTDWPNPRRVGRLQTGSTHSTPIALTAQPAQTPEMRQRDWPLPQAKRAPAVGFTQNRYTFAIEPMSQTPFFGKREWPIPPQPKASLRQLLTWTQARPQYYVNPEDLPPGVRSTRDWVIPPRKVAMPVGFTQNRWTFAIEPMSQTPFFAKRDWPIPPQPKPALRPLRTWTQARPFYYVEPGEMPIGVRATRDWPNPRRKVPPNVGTTHAKPTYYVDQRFLKQTDWPLPQPRKPAPPTWTQNLLQSTLEPRPFRQTDWPVFRPVVAQATLRTHLQARPTYYVETQGKNQYDWPLPRPVPRAESVRDWMRSHPLSLPIGPVARPDVIVRAGAEDVVIRVPADTVCRPGEV